MKKKDEKVLERRYGCELRNIVKIKKAWQFYNGCREKYNVYNERRYVKLTQDLKVRNEKVCKC